MADQLLSTTAHHDTLPEYYVRPESERPRLLEVVTDSNIPVINLSSSDKSLIISQIANACENYGFFQVVNHGITEEMLRKVMGIGMEFFRLSPEEKAKLYSDDPAKKMRLSTSFNVKKEKVHNWRDYLRLHCYPLEDFVPDWPSKPELFKEIMSTYCTQVRQLGFRLFGYISESLGLEEDYIEKVLGKQEQHMVFNYYPQCPEPELTYGLPAHIDPNALTILLQDQQVTGLQVLKEGKWIAVDLVPWALTINIGDQLQAVSNGRYRSVWHRAVVNSNKERMSIASFLCPCNSALICTPKKLTEQSPAIYRPEHRIGRLQGDITVDVEAQMSDEVNPPLNNIDQFSGFEMSPPQSTEQSTGTVEYIVDPIFSLIGSNRIRRLKFLAGCNLVSNTAVGVYNLLGYLDGVDDAFWRAQLIASVGAPIAVSVFTLLSSFRFASDPERWSDWITGLSSVNAGMIACGPLAFYLMRNRSTKT